MRRFSKRNNKKWSEEEIETLRIDYADWSVKMEEIAAKHGTSRGFINKMVRVRGWPMRRPPGRMNQDLEKMKNVRNALAWRHRKMAERLAEMDRRIREMSLAS